MSPPAAPEALEGVIDVGNDSGLDYHRCHCRLVSQSGHARGGYGLVGDIIVGIVGALLGGFLSQRLLGGPGITGFNLTSIIVAFIGACILIFLLRLVSRGTPRRTTPL
jgi:uncharacterized membrane protein YeaQ/YmgE (transglycosylase-associated protein family)